MARPRVLLAVTVYNGRGFVPRCLHSARHIRSKHAEVDVLALDDASPEPGFSAMIARLCSDIGVHYYRTPRNLGIVRNVNLGFLTAVERGYDYVIIANSDVIFSSQVVDNLLEAALSDPGIGSVTAWSNNVSIYSIPNDDPDANLSSQETVDWVAASLEGGFRGTAIDIPAGISFSILVPTPVLREVGLADPVFGRGYCEETDWSLRSLSMGYRIALAPAAFVYHQGRGSTVAAGMISGAHTTVPENEAIIDFRWPLFRQQVDAFVRGGILDRLHRDASETIVRDGGTQFGYDIHLGSLPQGLAAPRAQVLVAMGPAPAIEARFRGFACRIPLAARSNPYDAITAFFKSAPARVASGLEAPAFVPPASTPQRLPTYPGRV